MTLNKGQNFTPEWWEGIQKVPEFVASIWAVELDEGKRNVHNASTHHTEVYITQFQQECFRKTYAANPHLGDLKHSPARFIIQALHKKNRKKSDRRQACVTFSTSLSGKANRKVNKDKSDSLDLTLQVSICWSSCFLPHSHMHHPCCSGLSSKSCFPIRTHNTVL